MAKDWFYTAKIYDWFNQLKQSEIEQKTVVTSPRHNLKLGGGEFVFALSFRSFYYFILLFISLLGLRYNRPFPSYHLPLCQNESSYWSRLEA